MMSTTIATFNQRDGGNATIPKILKYMKQNNIVAIGISDANTNNDNITKMQCEKNHYTILSSNPKKKNSTVALIYSNGFFESHSNLFVDPSGRSITTTLQPQSQHQPIQITVIYQPPNLDKIPTIPLHHLPSALNNMLRSNEPRVIAERIRISALEKRSNLITSLIIGDFNETNLPTDRLPTNNSNRNNDSTITRMLKLDNWTDLYQHLNPSIQSNKSTPQSAGHTYFSHVHTSTSSRLDRILIWPPPPHHNHKITFMVDYSNNINPKNAFDHKVITATIPLIHQQRKHKPPQWKREKLLIPKTIDHKMAHQISDYVNKEMKFHIQTWIQQLKATTPSNINVQDTLNNIIQNYTNLLKTTYKKYLHQHKPPTWKSTLRTRSLLLKLQSHISKSIHSQHQPSPRQYKIIKSQIHKLKHQQHHQHLISLIANSNHTRNWSLWLQKVPKYLKQLKRQLKTLAPLRFMSRKTFRRKLLKTPEGRGTYYATAFHGKNAINTVIDKTMDANNNLVTDPSEYPSLIRDQVAIPFSNLQKGPAVYAGRSLSFNELTTGKPFWWNEFYQRNAAEIDNNTWIPLQKPRLPNDMIIQLKKCRRNTAPGYDAISTGILKIVTNTYFNKPSTTSIPSTANTLFLTEYVNAIFRTSIMPPSQKIGIISLHPKPGKNPNYALNRRPITLLPELGKLPFKILAQRLTKILHINPNILNDQQRAYLRNGSTKQCIENLIEITKDSLSHIHNNLIITTYDVKKAFDSIQHYSIEATLNRFNFPPCFITLILSALSNATSKVLTFHGLTDSIALLTSVRQGDPLAALLFILVLDPLHTGLRNNPLYPNQQHGYTISHNNQHYTTHALGYADDTNLINTTWQQHLQQHEWILDFFTAHRLSINADKTYTSSKHPIINNPTLPEHHQKLIHDPLGKPSRLAIQRPYPLNATKVPPPSPSSINIHNSNFSFRVLGLQYNIDLDPTEMTKKLQKTLYMTTRNLIASKLTISQCSSVIREFLYPKLELGLLFLPPPLQTLKSWDSSILSASFRTTMGPHICRLNPKAKWLILGTFPLSTQADVLCSLNTIQTLRSIHTPAAATKSIILNKNIQIGNIRKTNSYIGFENNIGLNITKYNITHNNQNMNSITKELKFLKQHNIYLAKKTQNDHRGSPLTHPSQNTPLHQQITIHDIQNCIHFQRQQHQPQPAPILNEDTIAFTDGSAQKSNHCGYATILINSNTFNQPNFSFTENANSCSIIYGSSPYAGQNFTAEAMAILRTLLTVSIATPLSIYSDCKSLLLHLQPICILSEGKALQLGAGSIVRKIRSILLKRIKMNTKTTFTHVKAHTQFQDKFSIGNEIADFYAKKAANDPILNQNCIIPFTHENPNNRILIEAKTCSNQSILHKHIDGNLRIVLLNKLEKAKVKHWAGLEHQGTVAKTVSKQLIQTINYLRNHHHNTLLIFLTLASTQLLPTATTILQHLQVHNITTRCPLCKREKATTIHALQCPRLQSFRNLVERKIQAKVYFLLRHLRESNNQDIQPLIQLAQTLTNFKWYSTTYAPIPDQQDYFGQDSSDNYQLIFKQIAEEHHTLSACLGFIPEQLQLLLYPTPETLGLPPEDYNKNSRQRTKEIQKLQLYILSSTKEIFSKWQELSFNYYNLHKSLYPAELLQYPPGYLYRTFNY